MQDFRKDPGFRVLIAKSRVLGSSMEGSTSQGGGLRGNHSEPGPSGKDAAELAFTVRLGARKHARKQCRFARGGFFPSSVLFVPWAFFLGGVDKLP